MLVDLPGDLRSADKITEGVQKPGAALQNDIPGGRHPLCKEGLHDFEFLFHGRDPVQALHRLQGVFQLRAVFAGNIGLVQHRGNGAAGVVEIRCVRQKIAQYRAGEGIALQNIDRRDLPRERPLDGAPHAVHVPAPAVYGRVAGDDVGHRVQTLAEGAPIALAPARQIPGLGLFAQRRHEPLQGGQVVERQGPELQARLDLAGVWTEPVVSIE